ncbi:MAG TPA: sulfatase, partial [Thermoanaerobaculia bacterium]|nr:sulfatase [Thermoanaerobaculia bacterium]
MDARALIVAATTLATSGLSTSCAPGEESAARSERRHLIVVAIDALRFDHTGLAGYPVPTTPALDRLAAEALVWNEARSASSYTLQSVSALFTGRLPSSGGSIGLLEAQPAESSITLASAFRRAGYRTALATNQPLLSGRGFTRGFDDVAVASAQESWPCAEVVRRGLAAFDAPDDGPRFLYLQLVEPHQPHTPSEDALRRFADAGTDALAARYDAEIATADDCLGATVEGLRTRDALDDSVLVVLGTQGEELGEHGDTGSGWTVYDEVLRVPLVVHAPGLLEAGRTDAPASIVDLYPTLLALHSLPAAAEDAFLDGRSLLAERGARFRSIDADDRAVIAELVIPERAIARAVIQGGVKYVATLKSHPPRERDAIAEAYFDIVAAAAKGEAEAPPLWDAPVIEELYDLAADRGETENLAAAGGATPDARLEPLRGILDRYRERCRQHGLAARQARPRAALPTAEEI